MSKSKIEWTETTWNPIAGCTPVSPGCANCYAARQARRHATRIPKYKDTVDQHGRWTGTINLDTKALHAPLHWKKPRLVFVNSMSDLFHEDVPDEWIDRIFAVMALCPQHTFQVLTKRPERMAEYWYREDRAGYTARKRIEYYMVGFSGCPGAFSIQLPLPNVWLGTSVEDQQRADERIPHLLRCPAAKRFLSCEPLLGPIQLRRWLVIKWQCSGCKGYFRDYFDDCPDCGKHKYFCGSHAFNRRNMPDNGIFPNQKGIGLDWVIAGGESGPNARPMHPDWVRQIRDDCQAAGVPFFFKQWGEWAPGECAHDAPTRTERVAWRFAGEWNFGELSVLTSQEMHYEDAPDVYRLGKKAAGRLLDGREWSEMP